MKLYWTRSAQSKIPGIGKLPGALLFQRDLSIRNNCTFYYASHVCMQKNSAVGEPQPDTVWFYVKSISTRVLQGENQSHPCISCRVGFLPILFWSWFAIAIPLIGCMKSISKILFLSGELIADALGFA